MPKKEINYKCTIIYKLVCNDINIKDIYVGHTTDFIRRKAEHKQRCIKKKYPEISAYSFMRDNGGWDNWDMILVEKYPCNDILEARARERYWIEELNASLNRYVPSRTRNQYIEENKDIIKENQKKYYENNKEKYKVYYEKSKEKNKDLIKEKNSNYYKNNKEKFRDYYKDNKERIKNDRIEYRSKKHLCECGTYYTMTNKYNHFKTAKHIKKIGEL